MTTLPTIRGQHPPLHQRNSIVGAIRTTLRNALLQFLRKLLATDDAKALLSATLAQAVRPAPTMHHRQATHVALPYPELGTSVAAGCPSQRHDTVIITARFRTGSTLLWNIFRHLPECTAYYEPLNERRWFDPTRRGTIIDRTHRGTLDYWHEYEGLSELEHYYDENWVDHHLVMDDQTWEPYLKRYIEILIERAAGRPVLQCNRIDFRLPWFRQHFPHATLVHLYRHPRDQWYSSLLGSRVSPQATIAEFVPEDKFYLLRWARDLKYQFPFLEECYVGHPYQLFYYIWKLSYWFGSVYAHHSLAFEDLVTHPDESLRNLFAVLGIESYNLRLLRSLLEPPVLGKWQEYASDDWFRSHETVCETVLEEFFAEHGDSDPPSRLADHASRHARIS